MNSIGSIWRKWDLHIHTPASFHWSGKRLQQQSDTERKETCKAIVEKMNSLDVDAFCIMDSGDRPSSEALYLIYHRQPPDHKLAPLIGDRDPRAVTLG